LAEIQGNKVRFLAKSDGKQKSGFADRNVSGG
jgi:hypothetical protein